MEGHLPYYITHTPTITDTERAWPLFGGGGEALRTIEATPGYGDLLVAVMIPVIAASVLLYRGLVRPRDRADTLFLLTAPPRAIGRVREMSPGLPFYLLGLLESLLVMGLMMVLLLQEEGVVGAMTGQTFWREVGAGALIATGVIVVTTVVQVWLVYTFCRPEQLALWWADYLLLWIITADLLMPLVLLLRLFTPLDRRLLLLVVGAIYLLYRGVLVYRELQIFTHLKRYPLHIFLYLCACELGPLIFLVRGTLQSVYR